MVLMKFEVGKPFPGPVPNREGAVMDLWKDSLVVLIQMPDLSRDERRAFEKTFKRYVYFESATAVPVAVWVFDFPGLHGPVDCNFDSRLVRREYVDWYLDDSDGGIKNAVTFFLLDRDILRGMKYVGLDHEAVKLFHATIRKQLAMSYSTEEYGKYLAGVYAFTTQEIMAMGRVFRHRSGK